MTHRVPLEFVLLGVTIFIGLLGWRMTGRREPFDQALLRMAPHRFKMSTRAHAHRCKDGITRFSGPPCECVCGAVLVMGPTYRDDSRFAWKLPDGSYAPFPDPNEESGIICIAAKS